MNHHYDEEQYLSDAALNNK